MKLIPLALLAAIITSPAIAQDPTGKYANSPNAAWFGRQHNAAGSWCCNNADGHIYDGDYTLNADGSVTIPSEGGGIINVETWKVLPFNPADPNPTGHAVIWYQGANLSAETYVYCFAIGPLT